NTTQALVSVVDRISRAEQGEVTIGVLLDFQKTCDTVQHKIILSKLLRYKIRGTPHCWFTNYLLGCQQRVIFNDCISNG
ncbi:hypothetical protein CAPTEDRAFT_93652, partial [Capitella teleta]